jgi:hypothetical protein
MSSFPPSFLMRSQTAKMSSTSRQIWLKPLRSSVKIVHLAAVEELDEWLPPTWR